MNKNILILGNGFIGNYLNKYLQSCNHNVQVLAKENCDYTVYNKFCNFIYGLRVTPDFIINASGYTGVPNVDACEYNKEKCWYYNVIAPTNIFKACKDFCIPMIHISSGCIYNGYNKIFAEQDTPNFGIYSDESSFYSKSKHAAEIYLKDKPIFIFRLRIPFCGDDSPRNYISKVLRYDKLINVQNSVTCVDDFCWYVEKFILQPFVSLKYGIYNVVNPGYISARDVIDQLSKYGIENPNHKIIGLDELRLMTKANRSNCKLIPTPLPHGEYMPYVFDSLGESVREFASNYKENNES